MDWLLEPRVSYLEMWVFGFVTVPLAKWLAWTVLPRLTWRLARRFLL